MIKNATIVYLYQSGDVPRKALPKRSERNDWASMVGAGLELTLFLVN